MTMIYTDGFDSYDSTAALLNRHSIAEAAWTWQATAGRVGGPAIQASSASVQRLRSQVLPFATATGTTAGTTVSFAFWLKVSTPPATTLAFLRILSSGLASSSVDLSLNSSGFLLAVGNTTLTGNVNICDNNWHYIEVRCQTVFTVVIDGVTTSGGTVLTGFVVVAFQWQSVLGTTITVDDFIMYDNLTGYPDQDTDFPIGPQLIHTIRPAADAAVQFGRTPSAASNADAVNEVSLSEADYVESAVLNDQDLYDYDGTFPGSPTPARIHTAMVTGQLMNPQVGQVSDALICRSGSTQSDGSTVLTPLYRRCRQQSFPLNPETAAVWSVEELNAAQFGVKVAAT